MAEHEAEVAAIRRLPGVGCGVRQQLVVDYEAEVAAIRRHHRQTSRVTSDLGARQMAAEPAVLAKDSRLDELGICMHLPHGYSGASEAERRSGSGVAPPPRGLGEDERAEEPEDAASWRA